MKITVQFESLEEFNQFIYNREETHKSNKTHIDNSDLSRRVKNCLRNANIIFLEDAINKSDNELLRMQNFGRNSLAEINLAREKLKNNFCMNLDRVEES